MSRFILLLIISFCHLSAARKMIVHIEPFSSEKNDTGRWGADAVQNYMQYAVEQMNSVVLSEDEWVRNAYGLEKYTENTPEEEKRAGLHLKKDYILKGHIIRDAYRIRAELEIYRDSDPKKRKQFTVEGSLGMTDELKRNLAYGFTAAAASLQTREFAEVRFSDLEKKRFFRNAKMTSLGFENLGRSLEKGISYEKSVECIRKALETDPNSPEILIRAGILFGGRNDLLDESISLLLKAEKVFQENGEEQTFNYLKVKYYSSLASYFKGEYNIALGQFLKVRRIAEGLNQTGLMYLQLVDFTGDAYLRKGQIKAATACLLEIKRRYEMMDFTDSLVYANVLNNLALHYQESLPDTSAEYLRRAEEHYRKNGYEKKTGYPNTLSNIANYHLEKKDIETALRYYSAAAEHFEKYGHSRTFGYANTLQNISGILIMKKEYAKSLDCLENAKKTYEIVLSASSWQYAMTVNRIADMQLVLGNREKAEENSKLARSVYERLGLTESHLYGQALESAGDIRSRFGDRQNAAGFYDRAYLIYLKSRKTDEAMSVLKKYKSVRESA